jgi:hypothetical protein
VKKQLRDWPIVQQETACKRCANGGKLAAGLESRVWRGGNQAVRITAANAGVLCGISGLEHGFFETLQGSARPAGFLIDAIGPAQRFWPGGGETAFTLVPNFMVTGVLAMLASLAVIAWSLWFLQRRYGAAGLLLLSAVQFLVGGGFAQNFIALLAGAAAAQIRVQLDGFLGVVPRNLRRGLAVLWPWLLGTFAMGFAAAMFAAVFGFIPIFSAAFRMGPQDLTAVLYPLGISLLGLFALSIIAALARDAERSPAPVQAGLPV